MSNKAKELEPERTRNLRNFRFVLVAFFAGIAIGAYVEKRFFMSDAEALWMWPYGYGKALIFVDSLNDGAVQRFAMERHYRIPVFKKSSEWIRWQINAYKTIETDYPKTGEKLRGSLLRILLLWPLLAAAITYTGISVLEARKDG